MSSQKFNPFAFMKNRVHPIPYYGDGVTSTETLREITKRFKPPPEPPLFISENVGEWENQYRAKVKKFQDLCRVNGSTQEELDYQLRYQYHKKFKCYPEEENGELKRLKRLAQISEYIYHWVCACRLFLIDKSNEEEKKKSEELKLQQEQAAANEKANDPIQKWIKAESKEVKTIGRGLAKHTISLALNLQVGEEELTQEVKDRVISWAISKLPSSAVEVTQDIDSITITTTIDSSD